MKAAHHFYLYGTFEEGSDTLPSSTFTFVLDSHQKLKVPCFLIWLYRDSDDQALLCKIRRTTKPADIGMRLHVSEAISIRVVAHGLMNTIYPGMLKEGMSGRDQATGILAMRELVSVPEDKSEVVKNVIVKSNPGVIDESYFSFNERSLDTEIVVEATDAIHTGFRLFGFPKHTIPELREPQILDFDIATIFDDAVNTGVSPDGKHFFEHGGRRLYLHKVHETTIEECLGVDLIYNYLDQRRLVFVQYKCQKRKGKYYPTSDRNHDPEVQRMAAMPGMSDCPNLAANEQDYIRLCRCPVFVKLCKREIASAHAVPVGVYYPLCVWRWQTGRVAGISVKDEPHINSLQFQELVKTGLIGSTAQQSVEIERHLIAEAKDSRLKLVFEEERLE